MHLQQQTHVLQAESVHLLQLTLQHKLLVSESEIKMSQENMNHNKNQHTDPTASWSPEDLVRLLVKNNYDITDRLIREERDVTNEKLKTVIEEITPHFGSVVGLINRLQETHERKIVAIENKMKKLHAVEEMLTDLNLKIETYGIYNEQLIYNLKQGIQDSLNKVNDDIKIIVSNANCCNICGCKLDSQESLRLHIQKHHFQVTIAGSASFHNN